MKRLHDISQSNPVFDLGTFWPNDWTVLYDYQRQVLAAERLRAEEIPMITRDMMRAVFDYMNEAPREEGRR